MHSISTMRSESMNRRIKAKTNGPPHTVPVVFTFTLNDTLSSPNPHGGQGSAIPYTARGLYPPSSLRDIANKVSDFLWALRLTAALRHREERSDPDEPPPTLVYA